VHVLPQISGNFPRHTDFPVGADVGADFTRRVAQRSAGHPREIDETRMVPLRGNVVRT